MPIIHIPHNSTFINLSKLLHNQVIDSFKVVVNKTPLTVNPTIGSIEIRFYESKTLTLDEYTFQAILSNKLYLIKRTLPTWHFENIETFRNKLEHDPEFYAFPYGIEFFAVKGVQCYPH